jgi:hypothetical protein
MKLVKYLSILAVAVGSITLASGAFATTSTINPAVPAQNSPLSSATLRSQFQAAYSDINALWAAIASSASGITALTGDVTCSGTGSVACALSNTATARANIGLPLGTSGATVGLLSSNLTFSGVDKHNLNAASLPTPQTGTILQLGNADGTAGRVEVDAFGSAGHFTVVDFGGTAASPTALAASTTAPIGSLNVWGYNGTSVVGPQAAVRAYATQAWSVGSNGTQLDFAVTPNGSSTLTQAMVINQDGGVTLGSPTGSDKGAGTLNGNGIYATATGAANTGYGGYFANTSTGGYGLYVAGLSQFTEAAGTTIATPSISTATFMPDGSTGVNFTINLVHAACPCTIANPVNLPVGSSGLIWVIQSSTGSDTIGTWGTNFRFAGGTHPTLTTTANAVDALSYVVRDSTHIQLSTFGLNFQ